MFPSVAEAIVVDVFINKGTSIQQQEKVPLPALRSSNNVVPLTFHLLRPRSIYCSHWGMYVSYSTSYLQRYHWFSSASCFVHKSTHNQTQCHAFLQAIDPRTLDLDRYIVPIEACMYRIVHRTFYSGAFDLVKARNSSASCFVHKSTHNQTQCHAFLQAIDPRTIHWSTWSA
jgi:hypothetical protein